MYRAGDSDNDPDLGSSQTTQERAEESISWRYYHRMLQNVRSQQSLRVKSEFLTLLCTRKDTGGRQGPINGGQTSALSRAVGQYR